MITKIRTKLLLFLFITNPLLGQPVQPTDVGQLTKFGQQAEAGQPSKPWQQSVEYTMEIDMDAAANQFTGFQALRYQNNSPNTLNRVFYHLFFNAFQPGSMMDKRSRTIEDPDRRVRDRIFYYDDTEIGYQRVKQLTMNGREQVFRTEGTILEVTLDEPILPGKEVLFEMDFEAQVPFQTRRSGRDNREGIRFSMSQWYPKIAAYDQDGWHPNPYVGREFYAPFGRFDVKITLDSSYIVAATGYLQGTETAGVDEAAGLGETTQVDDVAGVDETTRVDETTDPITKTTWHFVADAVHDFMWAADPDYHQVTYPMENGPLLRFYYQTDPLDESEPDADENRAALENWEQLPEYTARAFEFMNKNYGVYPYDEYVVIQGGDGGMEYIMGTFITGNRSLYSLVGVTVHELVHAWYHGVLGTNETTEQWIDEGFTVYLSDIVMRHLFPDISGNIFERRQSGYLRLVQMGLEEPMHIHSDHYERNAAYSMASYTKGALYLQMLGYIMGEDALKRGLLRLYDEWAFRHPSGKDVLRVMERESDMVLDWFHEYWVTTTKTIDYAVGEVEAPIEPSQEQTLVRLQRIGAMPMPIDLEVTFKDGTVEHHYIPMRIMWGEKPNENPAIKRITHDDWVWVDPEYELIIDRPVQEILRIEIDPSQRLVDINRENNLYEVAP